MHKKSLMFLRDMFEKNRGAVVTFKADTRGIARPCNPDAFALQKAMREACTPWGRDMNDAKFNARLLRVAAAAADKKVAHLTLSDGTLTLTADLCYPGNYKID